jgi:hypothetical protein
MTPYEVAFHETLLALGPLNLKNLVIVGGWCPYLYSKYVWRKQAPEIMTVDIDFAVKHMSPDHFSEPVYKKLLAANLIPRRMDLDDDNKFHFSYMAERVMVPIDFITEPDVLPKGQTSFKRPYVACDAVPEVAIALKPEPVKHTVHYKGNNLSIQIAAPEGLLLSKALLLEHRVNSSKTPKNLATIAFLMRYSPDRCQLLNNIVKLKGHSDAKEAGRILKNFVGDERQPGFGMLRDYFLRWNVPKDLIDKQIKFTFDPLISALVAQKKRSTD